MKILVTGKNGQVAQAMLEQANNDLEIVALGRPELDIVDKSSIAKAVLAHKPDVIVNAAAYTAVDKAESEVELAFKVNRDGARNVAEVAKDNSLPIIHISTDYVFNGQKEEGYKEDDAPGPLNVYGLSKLEGEWAVKDCNPDHVILRTAWVYSKYGNNFVKTMLKLAETRDEISVVCDQWGTPTGADFIAKNIINIAQQILSKTPPKNWRGIFHLVPDGKTNWADFAREIFRVTKSEKDRKIRVKSISSQEYQTASMRPINSLLNNDAIKTNFRLTFAPWNIYLTNEFNKNNTKSQVSLLKKNGSCNG